MYSIFSYASLGSQKVAFYKSKESQFSSGDESIDKLNSSLLFVAQDLVKIESEYYQFGEQKISKKIITPTFAKDLSIRKGYTDIGLFLTLKETQLKLKPSSQSTSLIKILEHSKLIPLKYKNGFIEVMYQGKKGFVDISNCISKFDYAYAIYAAHPKTKLKQWHYVKSRIFDQIEIYDQTQIPMSSVEAIFTNDKMGIITNKNSDLPLWSIVNLKYENEKPQLTQWNQSYLSGHGLVWWKSTPNDKSVQEKNQTQLNIDEILKKDVYSISSHPKDPKKSIISIPEGVFITSNGTTWTLLPQFKNYKGPVFYYNDNMIFVGSHRSTDQGRTFEQFINVNTISNAITKKLGYQPQSVKIKNIKSDSPAKISIDVDTGYKNLKLQTMIYNQNWEVIKY